MSYMGKVRPTIALTSSDIVDGAITTDKVVDDAVTVDKVANAINTSIAANTAKVTNATHTGDVTGATALTIATDAVDIAMLSATGTASSSTFLRGDNAWAEAGGGKVVQWVYDDYDSQQSTTSDSFVDIPNLSVDITLTNSSNKVMVLGSLNGMLKSDIASQAIDVQITRDDVKIAGMSNYNLYTSTTAGTLPAFYQDNPADTSAHTYKYQWKRRQATSGTQYMNSTDGNGCISTIMLLEIET